MKHFRKALELATMKSEQIFLTKKIEELNNPDANEADRGKCGALAHKTTTPDLPSEHRVKRRSHPRSSAPGAQR
jgi:hypothetical protein